MSEKRDANLWAQRRPDWGMFGEYLGGRMQMVVDADVVFAAIDPYHLYHQPSKMVMRLIEAGQVVWYMSGVVAEEILDRPRLSVGEAERKWIKSLVDLAVWVGEEQILAVEAVAADGSDTKYVALAQAVGADCLISCDRHLRFDPVWGGMVMTPEWFMKNKKVKKMVEKLKRR